MAVADRDAVRPVPVATFWQRHRDQLIPLAFVAPALAYVGYFAFYPAAVTIVYSFQTPILSFTTYNYTASVQSGLYIWIQNTLWVTFGALALQFGLALAIASILARSFRGKTVFATIVILPVGIATVVAGYVFSIIFNPSGGGYADSLLIAVGANHLLSAFGVTFPTYWTRSVASALAIVVIADSWKNTSLVVIILVAGYATIPKALYQAAAIDGAGPLRQFRYVSLPGLRNFIVMALLIRGAQEVNIFQLADIMIGSHPQLLTVQIYTLWAGGGVGMYMASAVSTVLLAIVAVFIVLVIVIGGRK
jgi:trehalose transport system permease protein